MKLSKKKTAKSDEHLVLEIIIKDNESELFARLRKICYSQTTHKNK